MVFNNKKILRKYAKDYWNKFLNDQEKLKNLLKNFEFYLKDHKNIHKIFAFYPIQGEPPILQILDKYFSTIYLPVINIEDQSMIYTAYKINEEYSQIQKNIYNIVEPLNQKQVIPSKNDLIIIPSLGINLHFARLGRGAGYYDRFFFKNKNSQQSIKISLLPEDLRKLDFKEEIHDLILDVVITENNIVYRK
jgi:5-formyltetrahydrofolate cyclo-ligase